MSKIKKFFKSPALFFSDAIRSHRGRVNKLPQAASVSGKASKISKGKALPGAVEDGVTSFVPGSDYRAILHSGEKADAILHLRMWVPHLKASGVRFLVVLRTAELYKAFRREYPFIEVALVKTAGEVDALMAMCSSVKVVFYPSNTGNNLHLIRFVGLTHVFLGHGDSDKSSSANKAFRSFDEVWTAGQAHVDRFKNAAFDSSSIKFVEVGRPGLREVLQSSRKMRTAAGDGGLTRGLYLPTWEGYFRDQSYSSLSLSTSILNEMTAGGLAAAWVKFHPFTGKCLSAYARLDRELIGSPGIVAAGISVLPRTMSMESALPVADFFVCDISAVISECLATGWPIFMYMPKDRDVALAPSAMQHHEFCYIFDSAQELRAQLDLFRAEGDRLRERRLAAQEYFMGANATIEQAFERHVRRLAQ